MGQMTNESMTPEELEDRLIDFAHKLSISLKELRETKTWLRIIRKADLLPAERLHKITDETDQLCAILSQSVHTAKEQVRAR
jgi:four helix bundle protein